MHPLRLPLCIFALAVALSALSVAREPIVGLPCEGCEAVFEGIPSTIASIAQIAPATEPGERLSITGVVRDASGAPVAGIIVYAYHTNDRGIYPRPERSFGAASTSHGRLRAWAKSDATGRYAFETIRPAGYPDTVNPAHIHLHVIEPGRCTYYIDNIHFTDDPRFTAAERRRLPDRGGSGIATPTRDASGTWHATRDIILGKNIPGYPLRTSG
mgnify:FL=1